MVLLCCEFKFHPHAVLDGYTAFAAMTPEQEAVLEGPGNKLLVRVHNLGNMTGLVIVETTSAEAYYDSCFNWTGEGTMDVLVRPILHEDDVVALLRSTESPPVVSPYVGLDASLEEGESLYKLSWKLYPDKKAEAFETLKNLTAEQRQASIGNIRILGQWFFVGLGDGFVLAAAKSPRDVMSYAKNWITSHDMVVEPVVSDEVTRRIVKSKAGYEKKLASLMEKMKM